MKRGYSTKGIRLSHTDCLIGAVFIEKGAILITENLKDFATMRLQVRARNV